MGLIKDVIIYEIEIKEIDHTGVKGFVFTNPQFELYLEDTIRPHLIISQGEEELRLPLEILKELQEKLEIKENKCLEISGIDEGARARVGYLALNKETKQAFEDEVLFKKVMYEELHKLCRSAEKACDENSEEYKDTIQKHFSIFKKLASL